MTDDGWEDKKDDIQEGVQDFPENAAHWTGEKVRYPTPQPLKWTKTNRHARSAKPKKSPTTSKKAGTASETRSRTAGTTPWTMSKTLPRTSPNGQVRRSGLWNHLAMISGMRMMRVRLRDGVRMNGDCLASMRTRIWDDSV